MSSQKGFFKTSVGSPAPMGPTHYPEGINFAIFSRNACSIALVLNIGEQASVKNSVTEIMLDPETNRTGDIWHIFLHCKNSTITYGYKVDGVNNRAKGIIFSPGHVLIDPYATRITPRTWGAQSDYGKTPCCIAGPITPFDWQEDKPLKTPISDSVIYELHVRGFSRHHSSKALAPGTYKGIITKIPYLKELGITAVELMPITEWDETDNRFHDPETGHLLYNYWGYNPVSFFAVKNGLAANPENCIEEFKLMVRSLHQAGIEVILDMVFNHTGEIGYDGKTTSFRGIDNPIYYILDQSNSEYLNFSGCGNTLNCNHPVVRNLIMDSLHYWVTEMHIDGFRFDLAAIFSRDPNGIVTENPPLIDMIAQDPLLRDTKIIAEAWDASGLYQVGSFSKDERWIEWNGRFRDDVRMFMQEKNGTIQTLATRIAGSSDLYQDGKRGPQNSINFLTSHDGFTLYDLVSYNEKVNHANGENNNDGENHNLSWNSGCEGPVCSAEINALRERRIRSFTALLMLSQGVPMVTAGDEFGRTQFGNNNSWCQDNEIGWIDWRLADKNKKLHRFFLKCIELRKKHHIFRRTDFFKLTDTDSPDREITWQSLHPGKQDWSPDCHTLAFLLHSTKKVTTDNDSFFIMINGDRSKNADFIIPNIPENSKCTSWYLIIDTGAESPSDIVDFPLAETIHPGSTMTLSPMGLIALQSGA